MTKTMKKIGSLLFACLLAIPLLCGPAAEADGLLEAMTGIALREGRTIEGTLRIEAEDLLASLNATPEGQESLAVAGDLLNNGLLRVRYTPVGERIVISSALELRGETLLTLDAWTQDDELALATSLLPGKTLILPAQFALQSVMEQLPSAPDTALAEALAAATERYGAVADNWAMQNEGILQTTEEAVPATQTRDAATRTIALRVTDAQWQDLIRSFAEEFTKDDVLQQALASQISGMEPAFLAEIARQLANSFGAPQGNAVAVALSYGEEEQIVGIDVTVEAAEDAPTAPQGSFTYGHRSIDDSRAADSFEVSFTQGEDLELKAQFYRRDKVPNAVFPDEGEEYGGRAFLRAPGSGALELEARGNIKKKVEPIAEAYDHTFDVRLSQQAGSVDIGDLSSMLQAPLLDAGFALNSQTEVLGMEDFRSQGSFTLRLVGLEVAIHYTLESIAYVPTEHPENAVIRLNALSEAEADALTQELQANIADLLGSAQSPSD